MDKYSGGILAANQKSSNSKKKFYLKHWQTIAVCMAFYDAVAVNIAYLGALLLRFDMRFSQINPDYLHAFYRFTPLYTAFCIVVFYCLRLYRSIWRFASYSELLRVITASVITTVFQCVFITVMFRRMPISYYVFGGGLQFLLILGIRFSYRFVQMMRGIGIRTADEKQPGRIMIVGMYSIIGTT